MALKQPPNEENAKMKRDIFIARYDLVESVAERIHENKLELHV